MKPAAAAAGGGGGAGEGGLEDIMKKAPLRNEDRTEPLQFEQQPEKPSNGDGAGAGAGGGGGGGAGAGELDERIINSVAFEQIQMCDEEGDDSFSRTIVLKYFEQAEETIPKLKALL